MPGLRRLARLHKLGRRGGEPPLARLPSGVPARRPRGHIPCTPAPPSPTSPSISPSLLALPRICTRSVERARCSSKAAGLQRRRGAGPFPCGGGGNADGWPETRPAGTTRDSLAPIPPALGLRQPLRAGPGAITIAQRRPPPPDGPRRGRHAWPPFGRLRGPQCDKRPESRHPGAAACSPKPAIPGNAAAAAAAAAAGDPGAAVEGHRPAALPVRREGGGGRGYMKEGVTEHEGGNAGCEHSRKSAG